VLEVRQLDAFYGDARALWGVNLDVRAGETVCVIGPNGAGKSTLVNAIARLHTRTRGRIAVGGTDVCGVATHRVCSCGVAIVPEGRRVFAHMTVYDNLCLGAYRPAARKTYKEQLERAYELFDALARIGAQGVSILLVEQDVERALSLATRAYLLVEGRVAAEGLSAELRHSDAVRAAVLGT
jgi:branched-chain amino acid transport system ATP-binding protein